MKTSKTIQTRISLSSKVASASIKSKKLLGREYSVLPAIMMVEGAYYPYVDRMTKPTSLFFGAKDIEQSVNTWNGRPVSINHPNGQVTCNSPETYDKQWLGYVFNAEFDRNSRSLKAELWLEKGRGAFISSMVENGKEIDVSIGAFGDLDPYRGSEEFDFTMSNIVGDHLAVLPDGVGACSWKDGCGIRAENYSRLREEKNGMQCEDEKKQEETRGTRRGARGSEPVSERSGRAGVSAGSGDLSEDSESRVDNGHKTEEKKESVMLKNKKENLEGSFNLQQWLDAVPEEARGYIVNSMKTYDRQREGFIKKIVSCKLATFCEKDLSKVKDMTLLESISDLIDAKSETEPEGKVHDYQIRAGRRTDTGSFAAFKDLTFDNTDYASAGIK